MKVEGTDVPKYAHEGDAGMDLRSTRRVTIYPNMRVTVGTGVSVQIPEGHVGLVFPRSGLASKRGITLANCVGVIDSGYRGEIMVPLHNISSRPMRVDAGERVCQLVIVPFVTATPVVVGSLEDSERGEGGLGSTGTD